MAGHCLGMLSDFTSFGALVRRTIAATRAARKDGGAMIGAMTAMQVAEWARRHGQPVRLELTGPAGSRFAVGEPLRLDAAPVSPSDTPRPMADSIEALLPLWRDATNLTCRAPIAPAVRWVQAHHRALSASG